MSAPPVEALTDEQRVRALCVRAASWALLDGSPLTDELLDVARYIETGRVMITPTVPAAVAEGGAHGGTTASR